MPDDPIVLRKRTNTPAVGGGKIVVWAKEDGSLWWRERDGEETPVAATGGGGVANPMTADLDAGGFKITGSSNLGGPLSPTVQFSVTTHDQNADVRTSTETTPYISTEDFDASAGSMSVPVVVAPGGAVLAGNGLRVALRSIPTPSALMDILALFVVTNADGSSAAFLGQTIIGQFDAAQENTAYDFELRAEEPFNGTAPTIVGADLSVDAETGHLISTAGGLYFVRFDFRIALDD